MEKYMCELSEKYCKLTYNNDCCRDCKRYDVCEEKMKCFNHKEKCGLYAKKEVKK